MFSRRFTIDSLVQLPSPFSKGNRGKKPFLGGWRMSTIVVLQKRFAFHCKHDRRVLNPIFDSNGNVIGT